MQRCLLLVALLLWSGGSVALAAELSPSEREVLKSAKSGQALQLAFATNRNTLPYLPVTITPAPGPQFLFSDKPEYFTSDGVSLEETVQAGTVRLYIYHVPEPAAGGKVIAVVVENPGNTPVQLRFLRRAFPRPGGDYHRIAKEALVGFLSGEAEPRPRSIAPGQRLVLDPKMDAAIATRDQLVHGFYEFEIDGPVRVSVLQRSPDQESVRILDDLPRLPSQSVGSTSASGAGRGRFEQANFDVALAAGPHFDTASGAMQLVVADGRRDSWIRGRDGIEARDARNVGNYGTVYRIRFKRASSDGRHLALVLAKLEVVNQYCGAVSAAVLLKRGNAPSALVPLPSTGMFIRQPGEVAVIQVFPPLPEGETEEVELVYSPPGAACLPTPFLLLPID